MPSFSIYIYVCSYLCTKYTYDHIASMQLYISIAIEYIVCKHEYLAIFSILNGYCCETELKSSNVLLKMQVYELLSCLCMYSDEGYAGRGYQLSTAALQHYKVVINYEQMQL